MRQICKKLGYVPGKRTFQTYLWRDYGRNVSPSKCKRLMNAMQLVAAEPKKDAYKYRATHDHETTAPQNLVNRDFKVGPRKIILTDITYLYYGYHRDLFYLCTFKDAYTNEILGCACSENMTVDLVRAAYDSMMEFHGKELKNPGILIHSDQGSQYLSTTFQRILHDDGFIQSCSRRGNSQDNAPMESFFGRLKTYILDLVARCKTYKTASALVKGYIHDYNTKHYQYGLAGLTPAEFYLYATTGIYPCDSYFGVKPEGMMTVEELVQVRMETARKHEQKKREQAAAKREEKRKEQSKAEKPESEMTRILPPEIRVARDIRVLKQNVSEQEKVVKDAQARADHYSMEGTNAQEEINRLSPVLSNASKALVFIEHLPEKEQNELWISDNWAENWSKYPELNYRKEMDGLFDNHPYLRFIEENGKPRNTGKKGSHSAA